MNKLNSTLIVLILAFIGYQQTELKAVRKERDELQRRVFDAEGAAEADRKSTAKWLNLIHWRLDQTRSACNITTPVGVP